MTVSVIIPTYNRSDPLRTAVRSVLDQQEPALECLVVDDGSTMSADTLQELVESSGAHWISQPHRGVSAARNTGIGLANGEWIAFLDSDDYWLPQKLALQMNFHRQHPDCLVSQAREVWYRNGRRIKQKDIYAPAGGDIFEQCTQRCCISPSSVVLHRQVLETVGLFDESMPVCEDFDLWLRISARYKVGLVEQSLIVKHGGADDQLSSAYPAMDRFRLFALIKCFRETELTDAQRDALERAIRAKSEILHTGAMQRRDSIMQPVKEMLERLVVSTVLDPGLLQELQAGLKHTWAGFQLALPVSRL